MEQAEGHKHSNLIVYVVIGLAVVFVVVLLASGSGGGSGGSISQPNPAAVSAADNATASEQNSANARVVGIATVAAEQRVGLATAKAQLRASLAETNASVEEARINAKSTSEVYKAQSNAQSNNFSIQRIVAAILANLNASGVAPVQYYPPTGNVSSGGNWYGIPSTYGGQVGGEGAAQGWSGYAP